MQSPTHHQPSSAGAMMEGSATSAPDGMTPADAVWMATSSHEPRRRPGTIYQGTSYSVGDQGMPAWEPFSLQSAPGDAASRPPSMQQDLLSLNAANSNQWNQKSCEDNMDLQGLEVEGPIGQAYTTDEAVPIIDLRYSNSTQDDQTMNLDSCLNRRRLSGSSLTTSGAMSDLPSYDDFSAALSEAPSYGSDYPSNRNSIMSSVHMSPVPSPRMTPSNRPEQVRAQSRGRATPSPRPSMRSVPYNIETSKTQRWSTGSYAPTQSRRQSPFIYNSPTEMYMPQQRMSYHGPPPTTFAPQQPQPMAMNGLPSGPRPQYMMAGQSVYQRNGMLLPSHMAPQAFHADARSFDQPPPLPSQGLFKMLQSNGDPHTLHSHYTDLSDPPDLFAALHEEQIPPPEEDMNPSDPDMVPYEQELRFEGDLYTPRWVRGHGNKREGWCGICKPGRWLVLKNSAFWYDKSFTHGISAATGCPFQEPLDTRRMDGNPDVWEGLCGSCHEWVALVSSKKKGTTWFRHAYKCHAHPKAKDGPKRRRDANTGRAQAAQGLKIKTELQRGGTPDMSGMATSGLYTPSSMIPQHQQIYGERQMAPVQAPEPLRLPGSRQPTALQLQAQTYGNML